MTILRCRHQMSPMYEEHCFRFSKCQPLICNPVNRKKWKKKRNDLNPYIFNFIIYFVLLIQFLYFYSLWFFFLSLTVKCMYVVGKPEYGARSPKAFHVSGIFVFLSYFCSMFRSYFCVLEIAKNRRIYKTIFFLTAINSNWTSFTNRIVHVCFSHRTEWRVDPSTFKFNKIIFVFFSFGCPFRTFIHVGSMLVK